MKRILAVYGLLLTALLLVGFQQQNFPGGGVTSVTGDGVLFSNSASVGVVTLAQVAAASGTVLDNTSASAAAPTFTSTPVLGAVGGTSGSISFKGSTSGTVGFGCTTATCGTVGGSGSIQAGKYTTTANCGAVGSAANPSAVACAAAGSGAFSCDVAASTGTCVVSTTGITANSEIIVTQVSSENARLSVTCNTTILALTAPLVSAKSAGTSFTLTLPSFATNPVCFNFLVLN